MAILKEYNLEGKSAVVTGAGRGIGKAIALTLAEAGYPNGFSTSVMGATYQAKFLRNMEWSASVLPAIGLKVEARPVESATFMSSRLQGSFDMFTQSQSFSVDDPDILFGNFYTTGGGANYSQYSNPEIDRLYAEQKGTLDPKKRKEIVDKMHKIVLQDVPIAVYGRGVFILATWAEVKNVHFPSGVPSYSAADISEVWIAQ